MIDLTALRERLGDSGWVMFDPSGRIQEPGVPPDAGPATLVVAPVTEAVKTIAGARVTGWVDRSKIWRVEAFLLNRIVLDKLGTGSLDASELLEAVGRTGFAWQALPRPGAGAP